MVSDKKIFSSFPYISQCKKKLTPGQGHFCPKEHNLNKFGRDPLVGDATYEISRLYVFWFQTRRFLKFSFRKSILGPSKDHLSEIISKLDKGLEELSFKPIVNRRTTDKDRSQKLNLSLREK